MGIMFKQDSPTRLLIIVVIVVALPHLTSQSLSNTDNPASSQKIDASTSNFTTMSTVPNVSVAVREPSSKDLSQSAPPPSAEATSSSNNRTATSSETNAISTNSPGITSETTAQPNATTLSNTTINSSPTSSMPTNTSVTDNTSPVIAPFVSNKQENSTTASNNNTQKLSTPTEEPPTVVSSNNTTQEIKTSNKSSMSNTQSVSVGATEASNGTDGAIQNNTTDSPLTEKSTPTSSNLTTHSTIITTDNSTAPHGTDNSTQILPKNSSTDSNTTSNNGNDTSVTSDGPVQVDTTPRPNIVTTLSPQDVPKPINVPRDEIKVPIHTDIEIAESNVTFENGSIINLHDVALENLPKNSETFQLLEESYKLKLEMAYKNVPNFEGIKIKGFRKGSLIIDYVVTFSLVSSTVSGETVDTQLDKITNATYEALADIPGANLTRLSESVKLTAQNLENISENPCQAEDVCFKDRQCINSTTVSGGVTCIHKCDATGSPQCQNGGYCVIDTIYNPVCRCQDDGDVVYSGEFCEIKSEHLALHRDVIIAIVAGSGGCIIFVLVVTVIILNCQRQRSSRMKYFSQSEHFKGGSVSSFKSNRDPEGDLGDGDIVRGNGAYVNHAFSNSELVMDTSRPTTNSRYTNAYQPMTTSFPVDLSNGYELQDRPRNVAPGHGEMVEITPDYPKNARVYEEIEDVGSKAIMYKGSSGMQDPTRSKIYDYDQRDSKNTI